MSEPSALSPARGASRRPELGVVLELLKPITWFPPMWAFACGIVASGAPLSQSWPVAIIGIMLAGPVVCAMSQAVNDWFDRHVDAINEPHRPIPSGRMPGRWGLYVALGWTGLSLVVGAMLGPWGLGATILAVILAWAYSAPPIRLKENGWWGNLACGLSYEMLPWITGAAVLAGTAPGTDVIVVALLYGLGAHGIMTLNDFKSIEGDVRMGVHTLPVQLGAARAARVACLVMAAPQAIVAALLVTWGSPVAGLVIAGLLAAQAAAMRKWLRDPRGLAPWYNGTGVTLYVAGMMTTAIAIAPVAGP